MWPAFEQKLVRFRDLELMLADSEIVTNQAKYTPLAKEHGSLARALSPYLQWLRLTEQIEQAQAMKLEPDPEMKELAQAELDELNPKRDALKDALEESILMDPSEEFDSLIVEIRAGVGGDEAALFTGDLYRMYQTWAKVCGFKIEEIDFSEGEAGGFREVTFSIKGDGVFQHLRFESGGHRVQRVPRTETQGRIHTSAATVAILPEPDEVQIDIKDSDIIWERMRAGGAGGQHVNKTESAVRIWYKKGTPDEDEVKCQDGRSQTKNYEQAMRILRSRVFERTTQRVHEKRADARRTLIGSGDRSERIRTYNFPQNRITDHRIGLTLHTLDAVIAGDLSQVIAPLRAFDRQQRLSQAQG